MRTISLNFQINRCRLSRIAIAWTNLDMFGGLLVTVFGEIHDLES